MTNLPQAPKVKIQKQKIPHERLFVDSVCQTLEKRGQLYQREVETPVGYIDVLTDNALYEAKHWSNIKHAVGQILFYGFYYPRDTYTIIAFAKDDLKDKIDYSYLACCMNIIDNLKLNIEIKTKEDFMLL